MSTSDEKKGLGQIDDKLTGWSFIGFDEPDGYGYLLQLVKHGGINYLSEVRVERIIVARKQNPGQNDVQSFRLGAQSPSIGPTVSRIIGLTLTRPNADAREPLGFYTPRLAVGASYEAVNLFGEPNQRMLIRQEFLFTPEAKDPSHEPSGKLSAARMYPLLKFRVDPIEKSKPLSDPANRICAVQVIFRLALSIGGEFVWTQSALFKDRDTAATIGAGIRHPPLASFPGEMVFTRAEKPLLYEIVGSGVERGWESKWDNIHAWDERLSSPDMRRQPFTPGLPYGLHTHWRWAASFYDGTSLVDGGKQFGGVLGAGTPIVDPNIADQDLDFAITLDSLSLVLASRINREPHLFFTDFRGRFAAQQNTPAKLPQNQSFAGAKTAALWYSMKAYSPTITDSPFVRKPPVRADNLMPSFGGWFFVHGLFVAHDDVRNISTIPDTDGPQLIPMKRPPRTWSRD